MIDSQFFSEDQSTQMKAGAFDFEEKNQLRITMVNVEKPGGPSPISPQQTDQSDTESKFDQKLKKSKARRGRPPLAEHERKERISISLDRPTLEKLRATGPGWQTRINELLAEVVDKDERFISTDSDKKTS